MMKTILGGLLFGAANAKIYYQDTFETDPFDNNRWVTSQWKQDTGEASTFEWSGGNWNINSHKGLRTTQDAKFYSISSLLNEPFNNNNKKLVFGLSVKHEQNIDCGGGYVKLLPKGFDQLKFNGDTDYTIMFGPDICGHSTKKVQTIFNHNGDNLLKKEDISCKDDEFTHFYLLILNPDDTYEIRINNEIISSGNLKDDWEFELPKKIQDPNAKKPSDWIDNEMIDDPNDIKPNDWDENNDEMIIDPNAVKPSDWDDEEDGEWQAPSIPNHSYKGEWKPKQIENPEYKGKWIHPEIDNPDYVSHSDVYKRGEIGGIGIEIWQVKSGTIFSDFILTDDIKEAETFYENRKLEKEDEESAKTEYEKQQSDDNDDEQENVDDLDDIDVEKDEL